MSGEILVFWLFAVLLCVAAVGVILSRNPVHAVLCLVLCFFQAAGLFILAGAEFLAMILVIVYVGAVAVLFLFVVMMLDIDYISLRQIFHRWMPAGLLIGLALVGELLFVIYFGGASETTVQTTLPIDQQITNTEALGSVLYTQYIYLFQAAGLILLVAMVGAIVLTLRVRSGVRKQQISRQVSIERDKVIEVRDIPSREGI